MQLLLSKVWPKESNMKRLSEAVLAKHKHMSHKASPYHAHSQGLEYTPSGKEVVRPIDTADAGYGGEAVTDAEGGEANPGIASKKAISPMPMQTLVKPGLDKAKKKVQEETERERLLKLRSFAAKNRRLGLGKAALEESKNKPYVRPYHSQSGEHLGWKAMNKHGKTQYFRKEAKAAAEKHAGEGFRDMAESEQVDELKKSTLASYATKALDDVSYHSFTAGGMSAKDPERLVHDKKAMKRQAGVEKAIGKMANEENKGTEADEGEYGYEGDMAMSQLKSIIRNAKDLHDMMEPQTDLPEWLQSKITLAADYIQTAADYWKSEKEEVSEGKMKDIATDRAEAERLLGGPVKPKASVVGGKGQPKNLRNLTSRLAARAMKAGGSVSEEVWDKPMPDSKKQGSLSPEQKAKAKARADRAGRSYPNMIDNMWASKQ